jgi:4'-phosphopantetheinyl transferase EntD
MRTPAFASLFDAPVEVVELLDRDAADALLPAEEAQLGDVLDRRRLAFAAGRHCAHRALERLGVPHAPILIGADREPVWPEGVLGSITHCEGYAAAAVARASDLDGLGIDAEPHAPLPAGVLQLVADESERGWIAAAANGICWDRVLFSAKESVFKAWFPHTRQWLGFHDAQLTFEPAAGRFRARLLGDGPELDGRYAVAGGLVLTALVAPRSA